MLSISEHTIDIEMLLENVKDDAAGATVLFLGTVRNHNDDYAVSAIYYEAYIKMAQETMAKIEAEAIKMEFEKVCCCAQNWQFKGRRS